MVIFWFWFIGDKSSTEITAKPSAAVLLLTVVWQPNFPDGQGNAEPRVRAEFPLVAEYAGQRAP
jgi:hypothetical protein